jgi:carboxyl-terminal processing protease
MKCCRFSLGAGVVGVTLLAAAAGFLAGPSVRANAQEDDAPYALYREALSALKREYFGGTMPGKKERELTEAAMRGMLYTLNDPFTSFLDRDEWNQMQQTTRGDFEGIGAVLEPFGQIVRVVRPIPDSPAYKAGVKAKDEVISVGAVDKTGKVYKTTNTLGKNINEVVKLIKGPAGTKVQITVMRKNVAKPLVFMLTRQHIEPPVVSYWMEDKANGIGRIVLNEFNEKSDVQFDKALTELDKQGLKALVFDLRYNPGGLLNVAVDMGSKFIDRGPVVLIQEKNGQRHELRSRSNVRKVGDIPTVVLINENSASASEIVAGALQDYKIAQLIGQHTFGKGLVQTLIPLSDGSALRLTTAKYFTPAGRDINNKYDDEHRLIPNSGGVKPDIEVTQSEAWTEQDFEDKVNDTQLKRALEVLRAKLTARAQR